MSVPFAAVVTPTSSVFTAPDGKTHTITAEHGAFVAVRSLIKDIGAMRNAGGDADHLIDELVDLVTPARQLQAHGQGRVVVQDGVVLYEGEPVHGALTERILWGLSEGFAMEPYLAFLDNVMENPSKRAVDELFTFVEASRMGITEDGHVLGYKRVRNDFRDLFSGTMDNSPGQVVEMARNRVNDDPNETCSAGLHFCSQSYLSHFGAYPEHNNKIVIVKVHPRDVVSVPVDYNAAKVRTCRYEVLSEYLGSDVEDLLATKPVFRTREFGDRKDDGAWPAEAGFAVGDAVYCCDASCLPRDDVYCCDASCRPRDHGLVEGATYIVSGVHGSDLSLHGLFGRYADERFRSKFDDDDAGFDFFVGDDDAADETQDPYDRLVEVGVPVDDLAGIDTDSAEAGGFERDGAEGAVADDDEAGPEQPAVASPVAIASPPVGSTTPSPKVVLPPAYAAPNTDTLLRALQATASVAGTPLVQRP